MKYSKELLNKMSTVFNIFKDSNHSTKVINNQLHWNNAIDKGQLNCPHNNLIDQIKNKFLPKSAINDFNYAVLKNGSLYTQHAHTNQMFHTSIVDSSKFSNKTLHQVPFKGFSSKQKPHIYSGGDFEKLVTLGTIFADKSLFIKEIFEEADEVILITMPRRWGKSVNLDMLKRFLEIKVDESGNPIQDKAQELNYKLFFGNDKSLKPLKIYDETLNIKDNEGGFINAKPEDMQGKYPVMYIDFKGCKGSSYEEVIDLIKNQLVAVYRQHGYLAKSDKLVDEGIKIKDEYNKCLEEIKKGDTVAIKLSLKNLSQLLHKHFGQKVWILVDEYDSPINHAFMNFKDEVAAGNVIDIFRNLFENALKTNSDNLEKGFITGVNRIAKANLFSGLNNITEYNFTNAKIAQYYGLDNEELNKFFDHFDVQSGREQVKQWYNGYKVKKVGSNEYIDKYNIWSIVKYLNNQEEGFKSYWEGSGNIDFINKLFKNPLIKNQIDQLLQDTSIPFTLTEKLSSENFKELKQIINLGSNYKITVASIDLFFSYLFMSGYLTIDETRKGFFKLPNQEIKKEFGNKMLDYYKALYSVDSTYFYNVTDIVQKIIDTKNHDDIKNLITKDLKDSIKVLFDQLPQLGNIKDNTSVSVVHGNEDLIHSILNYISLQIKDIGSFGTEVWTAKRDGRADIVMSDHKNSKGIIIELKYNGNVDKALEQSKKYIPIFEKHTDIKDIVRIGINLSPKKEVSILSDFSINPYYNPSGKGTIEQEDDSQSLPYDKFFNEYYSKGMEKILALRIKDLDYNTQNNVLILPAKYQLTDNSTDVKALLLDINSIQNEKTILVPYNIEGKHWVGMIVTTNNQNIYIKYIDPENKSMSVKLIADLKSEAVKLGLNVDISQRIVNMQKFNNCGPEVIEGFIDALEGERLSEAQAVPYHSKLLEQELLGDHV